MVSRHGAAVLRVANQFSLCHDDALDAYQRALEIYLRRMDTVEPATEGAWLRVVVKHEAMAIRRARLESVERHDLDLDENVDGELRDVEDAVAGGERVVRSVEALHALKPDEARALLLKAEGLSYQEIGRRFGWSYTKVNRSITEGRARFLKTFDGIEAGEQCEQHAATLTALAAGEATQRADRHDPPAPAPLRDVPRGGARPALLAHAADRAAAAVRLAGAVALAPGRDHDDVRGLQRRRAARARGGARRPVPERGRRGRGVCDDGRAAGAADHRARERVFGEGRGGEGEGEEEARRGVVARAAVARRRRADLDAAAVRAAGADRDRRAEGSPRQGEGVARE